METDTILIGDALPDTSLPILFDGVPMDLPPSATLNHDGSVTVVLDYPKTLKYRAPGSDIVAREEAFSSLTLRRLTGLDVRKMIGAKNPVEMALSIASGLGPAKLNLLKTVMDATDETAANEVVGELLGGMKQGLPDYAEDSPEGVTLPLLRPAVDEEGTVYTSLTFKRLTAAQRKIAADAASQLDWGIALATGVTPKLAKSLVDRLDGADAMAVNQVILFLFGSGRRTGR